MKSKLRRVGGILSLLAIGVIFPGVVRSATPFAKSEASVVRLVAVLNVANPQDVSNEIPFFKRIPSYEHPYSYLYGLASGFVVGEPGLVLTTAHMAKFDENDVGGILNNDAAKYMKSVPEDPKLSDADKTAIANEYSAALQQIPKVSKTLLDRKSIVQELYAVRQVKGTVEFRRAELYDNNKIDYRRDVALLRVQGLTAPAMKLNLADVATGEAVHVLGFPDTNDAKAKDAVQEWIQNRRDVVTSPPQDLLRFAQMSDSAGEVRRTVRRTWTRDEQLPLEIIEHGAPVTAGSSGGPLVNAAGQVIGLNVFRPADESGSSAVAARELDQLLQSEWQIKHLTTRLGPWINERTMLIAIAAVALIGIAALVIAFRKSSGPGQNTVMNWVAGARQPSAFLPEEPPPLPPDNPPSMRVEDYSGNSRSQSVLHSGKDSRMVTGRPDSTVVRSRRSFDSFELTPEEKGGTIIELDGRRFAKENGRLIMGRSSELAHVHVDDRSVSKRHAAVRLRGESLYIEDLESANGTLVNGKKLEPFRDTRLEPGDTVTIGKLSFRLRQTTT